jgi:apolipoprotein D and lipocalin family protein
VPDTDAPGKLKVEFFPLFAADYWVVDLWEDDPAEDYPLAVVSDPSREFLWILSRTPTVDPEVRAGLIDDLEARGFDMSRLQDTEHEGCVYDGVS